MTDSVPATPVPGVSPNPPVTAAHLTFLSLFAGIGGLDLGLERAGMTCVGQVEIDDYCQQVLAKHWPEVPRHDDVRTAVEWWGERPSPDVVCGGYPCQPFSTAGRMRGSEDPRHLWPAFANVLRVLRPRWALLENVPAHLGLGFSGVVCDLAALGFDAEWSLVPASAVGAPQRRPRLFVLAHAQSAERRGRGGLSAVTAGSRNHYEVADAHGCRTHLSRPADAVSWPVEPDVGRMADGVSSRLDRSRLYALGNAVVPQVAEYVGRLILEAAA